MASRMNIAAKESPTGNNAGGVRMDIQAASEWNIETQRRRTVLLDHLLLTAVVLGVVAMALLYVPLLETMDASERVTTMAPFVVGWLVLVIFWIWRGIGYRVRALTFLLLAYVLGIVIFAIGLFLANLAGKAVEATKRSQAGLLALLARIAILLLAGAMGFQAMGFANDVITLGFGLILGALAVAVALAFGLGGRQPAARQLEKWFGSLESQPKPESKQ